MRRKVKEFMEQVLVAIVMLTLFCAFVLSFIFVEVHFFKCVVVGILATIAFLALCWGEELISA